MSHDNEHAQGGADATQPGGGAQEASGADEATRQAFAGRGAFTGRTIPPQPAQQPTPEAIAAAFGPADAAAAIDTATAGATMDADLSELALRNEELTQHLQRLAADFDNFRKRARREVETAASAASDRLLAELVGVVDDLERALDHAAGDATSQLGDGIRMVHQRLTSVLTAHGLEEVDTSGMFDPHLHEALMMHPATQGTTPGSIVQVLQKGWKVGDRVIRHAKVAVAGEG